MHSEHVYSEQDLSSKYAGPPTPPGPTEQADSSDHVVGQIQDILHNSGHSQSAGVPGTFIKLFIFSIFYIISSSNLGLITFFRYINS